MVFNLCLLLLIAIILYTNAANSGNRKNLVCESIGSCLLCGSQEIDADYCRDTGRRMKIHCKNDEREYDDYKSCITTAEDDQVQVIIFQVIMAVIGGLAYWGVQSRKRFNMTLFDHRKMRERQHV